MSGMHYQEPTHAEWNWSLDVWLSAICLHRMSKRFFTCDCFSELAWGCGLLQLVVRAPLWRCFPNGSLSLCQCGHSSFHFWGSTAIFTPLDLYFHHEEQYFMLWLFFFCGSFFFKFKKHTVMVWGRWQMQCKIFLSKVYCPDKKLFIVTYDISELWVVVEFSI